jgi:arylsulfate sulfotransferase
MRLVRSGLASIIFAILAACGSSSDDPAVEFVQEPEVEESPANAIPLARIVSLETNVPTRLQFELSDGADHQLSIVPSQEYSTQHEEMILGLKAGRDYELLVTATSTKGRSANWQSPSMVTTVPLPSGFPPITVLVSDPDAMEPGVTLINVLPRASLGSDGQTELEPYLIALDESGDVVWYLEGGFAQADMLENGNLLTTAASDNSINEITILGEPIQTWYSSAGDAPPEDSIIVDSEGFHHDAFPMNGGESMLVPSYAFRTIEDYPIDEQDPSVRETSLVRDTPVIEFTSDGTVVNTWNFLDLLRQTRIGFDGTQIRNEGRNWAHTNAVIYDETDDAIIASLRNQDAVVKVSRATGELLWILGTHANWAGWESYLLSPTGSDFAWQYHQHAPMLTTDGTIILFDNGNNRASPFTGEVPVSGDANFSRAVEFAIDEEAMTVSQVWEWGLPQSGEQLYAPFLGDANQLPETDNVLITFAGLCKVDGLFSDAIRACATSIRVNEIARGDNERIVFDILIEEPDPDHLGWRSYRSERLPSLYGPDG